MLQFLKKHIHKPEITLSFEDKLITICERFFSSPHHQWIASDKHLTRDFSHLIDSFPEDVLDFFANQDVKFIRATGKLSCALSLSENTEMVIIFPDLLKLLKSGSPTHGIAVLAHELGHIYHRHQSRAIPTLQAQLEADHFAYSLGFGRELYDILLDYFDSDDCKKRLQYLDSLLAI
jgi:hypothetical protein